jgi:hypothetical protein
VYISAPGPLDERYVRMHLFGCAHWFDGRALGRFQRNRAFRLRNAGGMQRLLFNFSKAGVASRYELARRGKMPHTLNQL